MNLPIQFRSDEFVADYSRKKGLSLRDGLRALMRDGVFPERFRRNEGLVSPECQLELLDMPLFIAGCGGLGGEIAAQLARFGAGRLFLCDYDKFEESNLNRQRFCNMETLGRFKAETAAEELSKIAPFGEFHSKIFRLEPQRAPETLAACALVIDCLDSTQGKKMLENMARTAGRPWLHGAVLQFEGFACLRTHPRGLLERLYGADCRQDGAGSVLANVVAGTASLMLSLFVKWLHNREFSSRLIHADFSVPEVESLEVE